MKIIAIDGPNKIGVSSQARVLSLNLKSANKNVQTIQAKNIDELMIFLTSKLDQIEYLILDGFAGNDLAKAIMDSSINSIPFKKYPNFINLWIEFNLKNNVHNILILPDTPASFLDSRKIDSMEEFMTHTNALNILPEHIPHNGLKYTKIHINSHEKILQTYKKVVLSDPELDFLKYLS